MSRSSKSTFFVWLGEEWENYLHSGGEKYKLMSENQGERITGKNKIIIIIIIMKRLGF